MGGGYKPQMGCIYRYTRAGYNGLNPDQKRGNSRGVWGTGDPQFNFNFNIA
jgi:hypothetical protein